MKRWLTSIIRRWRKQRIRTKKANKLYRTIARNRTILENGGIL